MFNNPALDVAIGLVFIYALYSLLATTITELIATMFNQRGKILRTGIRNLLDNFPEDHQNDKEGKRPSNLSKTFYDLSEIKYLGKKSIFSSNKRLPSSIKPSTFAKGLLNILQYSYDKTSSLSDLVNKLDKENKTHVVLINLLNEANNSVERFKQLVEDWFNETMDRVSGWYKRRIQIITFLVGLFIAFSMHIDTIQIADKLGKDEKTRLALVEAATGYSKTLLEADTLTIEMQKDVNEMSEQIDLILKETASVGSIMSITAPNNFGLICKTKEKKASWFYVFGCFLTAVALSLGAPFWFDLLNKLVKLRGAGNQESTTKTTQTNKAVG